MHWEYEKYADYGLFLVVLIEQIIFGFESTKIRVETAEIFWFDSSPVSIETFPAGGWVAGSNGNKTNSASIEAEIELNWVEAELGNRLLGPSWTDSICSGDICPSNICPGDICPYQEYLSCYRPDFDKNLKVGSWDHFEHMPTATATFIQVTFVLVTFVYKRNISAVTDPILTKLFEQDF